jgi:anti-sigma-K factor RskA
MNCLDYELDLDDYVEGRLDADTRIGVERHLQTCAECRALVADLRALQDAMRTLEPHVPSQQVWNRVAAAIDAETRRQRTWQWFDLSALGWRTALSAACTIALLVGGVWLAFRDVSSTLRPVPERSAARAVRTPDSTQPVGTTFDVAEAHYANTINSLEQITKTESDALDTPTVEVVQANLAVLDKAIGDSREALQTDPSNDVAQESLFDALRSKVALLQDTIALINEMRKGNQEGAARIMSGMNQ